MNCLCFFSQSIKMVELILRYLDKTEKMTMLEQKDSNGEGDTPLHHVVHLHHWGQDVVKLMLDGLGVVSGTTFKTKFHKPPGCGFVLLRGAKFDKNGQNLTNLTKARQAKKDL